MDFTFYKNSNPKILVSSFETTNTKGLVMELDSEKNAFIHNNADNGNLFLGGTALCLDGDNNVGIRTLPSSKLHVKGDFHIEETNDGWSTATGKGLYLRFYGGAVNRGYIQSIDRLNSETYYHLQYDALNHYFKTKTGGITYHRMKIAENGNVGIGDFGSDEPIYKLDVRGAMRLGDGSTAEQDIWFVSAKGDWQLGTNNNGNGTDNNHFYIYNGGTYRLTVQKGTGNVGIGTSSPVAPLHVSYTNGAYNNVQGFINECTNGRSTTRLRSTGNHPSELFFDVNGAIRWDFSCRNDGTGTENDYNMYIYNSPNATSLTSLGSDATPVMVLTQSGSVGIGTTSPGASFDRESASQQAKLHVNGGYLYLSHLDNDSGAQQERGGCICFESPDNSNGQGEHALIAVHAWDQDGTTTGRRDRSEMLFYMGNNHGMQSNSYGPDQFTFVGSSFNVFAGNNPVSIDHPGDNLFGMDAAKVISGRCWGDPTTGTDQVPNFTVSNDGRVGIGIVQPSAGLHIDYAGNGLMIEQHEQIKHESNKAYYGLIFKNPGSNHTKYMGYAHGGHFTIGEYDPGNGSSVPESFNEMLSLSNGKMGIGTSPSSATLDVRSSSSETKILIHNDDFALLQLSQGGHQWNLEIGRTAGDFTIYKGGSGNGEKLRIKANGNVGIGNFESADPAYNLHVNGTIGATSDITAFHSSDKRLKNNLIPIKDPLEKLKKINGYTFVWIENEHHPNKGSDIGVVAQEVEEILPEITTTRENGYKAVRYEKLTPFLISCIKEQQTQIENQQTQISSLQSQIDELKALIKNN